MEHILLDRRMIHFISVVEYGSFSNAERTLNLSKQALTKQVNSLEADLGFTLLQRGRRGVRLTPAGEELYQSAKKLMEQAEQIVHKCRTTAGHPPVIRLGKQHHHMLMESVVRQFEKEYPNIRLQISLTPSMSPIERIYQGLDDVGEVHWVPSLEALDLSYTKLISLPYNCLMADTHILADQTYISLEMLKNIPVTIYRMQWLEAELTLLKKSASQLKILNTMTNHIESVYSVCEKGGIFITPSYYAYYVSLTRIPLANDTTREYGICCRKNASAEVLDFVEVAKRVYEQAAVNYNLC